MENSFSNLRPPLPNPHDQELTERGQTAFHHRLDMLCETQPDIAHHIGILRKNEKVNSLLTGIFGCSPYLSQLLVREAAFLIEIDQNDPESLARGLFENLQKTALIESDQKAVMKAMRVVKRKIALLCAVMDLGGIWPLLKVTEILADCAESCLEAALRFLLLDLHRRKKIHLKHPDNPTLACGFFVLAMGKLGSKELNYSSDIDVIVMFDPEKITCDDQDNLRTDMVRLTRDLVNMMDARTGDGYVFRTDLRLRPDPGATPLAVNVRAAESYYESLGQNWERAAMIKARPIAGDLEAADSFLRHIRPFIWRKHLDFAAINDIHSIKRQINAYRGGQTIAINGHDIKIGRGGIREIEFFAQTQQLIWGGRIPDLREMQTCRALDALVAHDKSNADQVDDLKKAYDFLRRLEHRIQMVNDEQTQKLPEEDGPLENIAFFMGYDGLDRFKIDLKYHLQRVEYAYARLFEDEADLGQTGSLVFTGTDDDPDTMRTIADMGFVDPSRAANMIRNWHRGRYRAFRSERARQLLTELTPRLLNALAATASPDDALLRFDQFLSGLPSGVQIFSLFHAQPDLLDLVAQVMGDAPRLSHQLARRPLLLDSVLAMDFTTDTDFSEQLDYLDRKLSDGQDYQDSLDITRRWTNDQKFRVGIQLLQGQSHGQETGPILSDIADAAIATMVNATLQEFGQSHGLFEDGGFAVLALGKLGGRELMPMSDADLIFVYTPGQSEESNGPKPLSPGHYFQRYCQRIVSAISAETSEGHLYEVDARLRPSGNAGPLATRLDGFEKYYLEEGEGTAWTWEYMALTRARVISGPADITQKIEAILQKALTKKRDKTVLAQDIATMRARIAQTYSGKHKWDIKYRAGGLVDVEFIAQYLQLAHAHTHPDLLTGRTKDSLEIARNLSLIHPDQADILLEGLRLWQNLQAVLRLTSEGQFDASYAPEGQKNALVRAASMDSFDQLEKTITDLSLTIRKIFTEIVGEPVAKKD